MSRILILAASLSLTACVTEYDTPQGESVAEDIAMLVAGEEGDIAAFSVAVEAIAIALGETSRPPSGGGESWPSEDDIAYATACRGADGGEVACGPDATAADFTFSWRSLFQGRNRYDERTWACNWSLVHLDGPDVIISGDGAASVSASIDDIVFTQRTHGSAWSAEARYEAVRFDRAQGQLAGGTIHYDLDDESFPRAIVTFDGAGRALIDIENGSRFVLDLETRSLTPEGP